MGGPGTQELVIEQKVETPLAETVEKVGDDIDVLCTRNYGNWFLVGTADGLYATTDGVGYSGPKPAYPEQDEDPENNVVSVLVGTSGSVVTVEDESESGDEVEEDAEQYSDQAVFDITEPAGDLVFAACANGVYAVRSDPQTGFKLIRVNAQGLKNCRKVCYDQKSGTLYVSVGRDLYSGHFDASLSEDSISNSVSFRQASVGEDIPGKVTGLVCSGDRVFASTLSGLAVAERSSGNDATRLLLGTRVLSYGKGALGTTYGLYDTDGNILGLPGYQIYSVFGYEGGYLLGSDSQIIDFKDDGSFTKTNFVGISGSVDALAAYGSGRPGEVVIFKTGSGDVYQYSISDNQIKQLTSGVDCAHFGESQVVFGQGSVVRSYSVNKDVLVRTNTVESAEWIADTRFKRFFDVGESLLGVAKPEETNDQVYLISGNSEQLVYQSSGTVAGIIRTERVPAADGAMLEQHQNGSVRVLLFDGILQGILLRTVSVPVSQLESPVGIAEVGDLLYVLTNMSVYIGRNGEDGIVFEKATDVWNGGGIATDGDSVGVLRGDGVYSELVSADSFSRVQVGSGYGDLLGNAGLLLQFPQASAFVVCRENGLAVERPMLSSLTGCAITGYSSATVTSDAKFDYAYPYVDYLNGQFRVAGCSNGQISVFQLTNDFGDLTSVGTVDANLGYDSPEWHTPYAAMYKNFQESSLFVLSDYDFLSDGVLTTANYLSDVPMDQQPEILSSFLCAEFVGNVGSDGGLVVRVHMDLSVNSILGDEAAAGEHYLPRVALLETSAHHLTYEQSFLIVPDQDDKRCSYFNMVSEIGSDVSSYFPSVGGVALFGDTPFKVEDTQIERNPENPETFKLLNPVVPIVNDIDEPYSVCAMWDGDAALFPDRGVYVYDDASGKFV